MAVLTYGEQLILFRRRQGMTKTEMMKEIGCSRRKYNAEEDRSDHSVLFTFKDFADWVPQWHNLYQFERCFIWRRRSKLTQKQVAEKLGVSRETVNQMERGHITCRLLVEFWDEN